MQRAVGVALRGGEKREVGFKKLLHNDLHDASYEVVVRANCCFEIAPFLTMTRFLLAELFALYRARSRAAGNERVLKFIS